VRIIAGTLGGRTLHAPSSLPVRPTTDYAKSGLFNILNNRISFEGLQVLDLFCGAGGITFEFASRGAAEVVSVDRFPGCVRFVRETAAELGLRTVRTVRSDVFKFIDRPATASFDVVFADPPFDMEGREDLQRLVLRNGWLKPGGIFILEHPSSEDTDYENTGIENRRYGNCSFAFFQHSPEQSATSVLS
jgi:16S rRNA (guanine(966)-N(2))-methyltransferase RsmD